MLFWLQARHPFGVGGDLKSQRGNARPFRTGRLSHIAS